MTKTYSQFLQDRIDKAFAKKETAWICSCRRKNSSDDNVCGFCGEPRSEKAEPKKKRGKSYDEEHLWPVFSLYIRLRDSDKKGIVNCITCGKPKHYTKVDCGHGMGRQYKATKYNEQNNHGQCKHCNGFNGGMRDEYKVAVDRKYGPGTWDRLKIAARGVFKLGKTEVDFLVAHYTKEIERLKQEKELS